MSTVLVRRHARAIRSFGGVAVVLAAVAIATCYIPARRATRVNRIIALRDS